MSSTTYEAALRTLERTRVFVLALKAGGTAKTSSCTALATELGMNRGYRVLVIDLDPQCHSSQVLGRQRFAKGQLGITDVIKGEADLADIIVPARYRLDADPDPETEPDVDPDSVFEIIPRVYVAPCNIEDPEVDELNRILTSEDGDVYWLRDGLADVYKHFDIVLIDCPASYDRITVTAFVCLDDEVDGEVLPPVLCTFKEAGALVRLEAKLKQVRERPKFRRKRIQPRMFRVLACSAPTRSFGKAEHWETLEELQEEYAEILLPLVHWSGWVPRIYRFDCAVNILAPKSRPAEEYAKVATALGLPRLD